MRTFMTSCICNMFEIQLFVIGKGGLGELALVPHKGVALPLANKFDDLAFFSFLSPTSHIKCRYIVNTTQNS